MAEVQALQAASSAMLSRPAETYYASAAFDLASPVRHIDARSPPFLVIHGDRDTLVPVDQARHFARDFAARAEAPICYAEVPGAQHAYEVFPSLRTEHTVRAVARYCEWVRARVAGKAGS